MKNNLNKEEDDVKKMAPDIEDIYEIYKKYAVGIDILEKRRLREIVDYRVFFVKLCVEYTSSTFSRIARFIKKDHSTVHHYLKHYDAFVINNRRAYETYLKVEDEIIHVYPSAVFVGGNDKKKEARNIEMVGTEMHQSYARRFHAQRVKIDFYKDLCQQQKATIKKLTLNEV